MGGVPPKPAHLRQRTNKKSTYTVLDMPSGRLRVPAIPNPDGRAWHVLTVKQWSHAWRSPMAAQWLETDLDALGRLAVLWDDFNQKPSWKILREIRLQAQQFGLTPLDRSRLQWEVRRAGDPKPAAPAAVRTGTDPRIALVKP